MNVLLIAIITLLFADAITTHLCELKQGTGSEGNPLMRRLLQQKHGMFLLYVGKGIVSLLLIWLAKGYEPIYAVTTIVPLLVVYTVVVINNICVLLTEHDLYMLCIRGRTMNYHRIMWKVKKAIWNVLRPMATTRVSDDTYKCGPLHFSTNNDPFREIYIGGSRYIHILSFLD